MGHRVSLNRNHLSFRGRDQVHDPHNEENKSHWPQADPENEREQADEEKNQGHNEANGRFTHVSIGTFHPISTYNL